MSSVMEAIEVEAPVSKVYDQWTQVESFPEFMRGVDEIKQLDAEITEQHPDERVEAGS